MTPAHQIVFDAINKCIRTGNKYELTDPARLASEYEKLTTLGKLLKTVTIFEHQLVTDLDVD